MYKMNLISGTQFMHEAMTRMLSQQTNLPQIPTVQTTAMSPDSFGQKHGTAHPLTPSLGPSLTPSLLPSFTPSLGPSVTASLGSMTPSQPNESCYEQSLLAVGNKIPLTREQMSVCKG